MRCLDCDGFIKKFINLDEFIPVTYEDFYNEFIASFPYPDFIEDELVYKDAN